jgi:hypothetical protein
LAGDWVRIRDTAHRNVAKLEAALKALDVGIGGDGEVKFHRSSDEILRRRTAEYWPARHGRCSEVLRPEGTRRDEKKRAVERRAVLVHHQ